VANGEVITSSVVLSNVLSKLRAVSLGVVGAGEDSVGAVLVENVGIEKFADTGGGWISCVAKVVGALLLASSGTDAWVIWLGHQEGLDSHVGVGGGWCDD
jgi:hypothetical protein